MCGVEWLPSILSQAITSSFYSFKARGHLCTHIGVDQDPKEINQRSVASHAGSMRLHGFLAMAWGSMRLHGGLWSLLSLFSARVCSVLNTQAHGSPIETERLQSDQNSSQNASICFLEHQVLLKCHEIQLNTKQA